MNIKTLVLCLAVSFSLTSASFAQRLANIDGKVVSYQGNEGENVDGKKCNYFVTTPAAHPDYWLVNLNAPDSSLGDSGFFVAKSALPLKAGKIETLPKNKKSKWYEVEYKHGILSAIMHGEGKDTITYHFHVSDDLKSITEGSFVSVTANMFRKITDYSLDCSF